MKNVLLLTVLLACFTVDALAATYKIDSAHSSVSFKIKHLAISTVGGQFGDFAGTFNFDPANVAASSTEATIKVASIDTRNGKRDDHLRSPDFFDAKTYPEMIFKSTGVHEVSDSSFKLTGDLTMHGITKPVTLDVEYNGTVTDPYGVERAGFTATATLNRKDFGLMWSKTVETGALVVGDNVKIEIGIEGTKQ